MRKLEDWWPGIFLAIVITMTGLMETFLAPRPVRAYPALPPLPEPPALELRLTSRAECQIAVTLDRDRRVFTSRELTRRLGFKERKVAR